jgi:Putative transposase DNA-binding domain
VAALTSTATCTAFRAVAEATGELVPAWLLAERVRSLAALIQELATAVVATRWNDRDLATLDSGVSPDGRMLPAKGWMALRRLGWAAAAPEGVHVSDRVRRAAEEAAARALRSAVRRRAVVHAILESWPADPWQRTDAEWTALHKRLSQGVSNAEIRNRTRQLRAFRTDHGGRLPVGLTELETVPRIPAQVVLAAGDKQLVTIEPTGPHAAVLRVQLPLTSRPTSLTQWAWHAIPLAVPEHVPACVSLCAPTLRLVEGRVRVDLPWRIPVPRAPRKGHAVALGLDWGVNTLLTGTVGKLADTPTGSRVVTDGRMLRFATTGVSAKLHRLRGHRQTIATRRDHYARLLDGLPEDAPAGAALITKHEVLEVQHQRVCDRIRRLNHALAWAAARWAVNQAHALGASVIYVEDLANLEARGRRKGNARLSGQVRGKVVDAIHHLAAKAGIATVTVPARGTSKHCPRCGKTLRHVPAPDRVRERGWKWAVCPGCRLASDRDHAATERIVARGLLAQDHVQTNPKTGQHATVKTVDGNVARARRPTRSSSAAGRASPLPAVRPVGAQASPGRHRPSPNRPQPRPGSQPSHRVPDRRAAPAPAAVVAGKRPAGQAPQTHHRRSTVAGPGPAHDHLRCLGPPRPSNRWGFHRSVTATPILRLGDFGPATTRPRPSGAPRKHSSRRRTISDASQSRQPSVR